MEEAITFGAPWGTTLKLTTLSVIILLTAIAVIGFTTGPKSSINWLLSMSIIPLVILVIAAFFTIRGYVIEGDTIFVRRIGWNSEIELAGLVSAEADPEAMSGSIRTFGNGGMFCIAGSFRNKKLGSYRAFATDPQRSVVLKFDNRVIVITPDDPAAFTDRINKLIER